MPGCLIDTSAPPPARWMHGGRRASRRHASGTVLPVDGQTDEETGAVRMRVLPPLDERRATHLEYVIVVLTIAVIVALVVWFLGAEILAGTIPHG